jgi:hypothetical protein
MKKNKRGEIRGRCREQRKGEGGRCRDVESKGRGEGGRLNVGLGLGNFLFILVLFLSGGLVEPIWFGSIGFRL